MNTAFKLLRRLLIWPAAAVAGMVGGMATADIAAAQESPPAASSPAAPAAVPAAPAAVKAQPKSTAQLDAGEPRANTSPAAGAPAAGTPAAGKPGSTPAPPRAPAANNTPKPPGQKAPGAVDRLNLDTATVTGEREQPKVMYIVPWKKSDIGDLSGKPMNSLLDEALAPVDRDEFKREVAYYGAVRADASQNGASKAAKQGEK
jgi:hypothetical protein